MNSAAEVAEPEEVDAKWYSGNLNRAIQRPLHRLVIRRAVVRCSSELYRRRSTLTFRCLESPVRRGTIDELSRRPRRTQNVNRHLPSVLRRNRKLSFALRVAASPDAPDQPPFVAQPSPGRIIAAVGRLETARHAKPAHERAPCADPPRRVEEHEGVRALEPKIECDVAVNDPLLASEQGALLLAELVLGRPNPAGIPAVEVEMDDGKAGLRRERRENVLLPAPAMPVTTTRLPTARGRPISLTIRRSWFAYRSE